MLTLIVVDGNGYYLHPCYKMITTSMDGCSSCCLTFSNRDSHPCNVYQGSEAPYALTNLIAAGTLILQLNPDQQEVVCDHAHYEDGWYPFNGSTPNHCLLIDDAFRREIEFLIKHQFISVTYRLGTSSIVFLRIYIVPYDLGGIQGKLRIRKENVLIPARRFMRALLPNISQSRDYWNGIYCTNPSPVLIPNIKVTILTILSLIFAYLPDISGSSHFGWYLW